MFLDQITPLILSFNEAPNIGRVIEKLSWAQDIVVVDSFSDDATLEILSTFNSVRIYQRRFDTHKEQWSFGLSQTQLETEWILALDSDYVLTDAFVAELGNLAPKTEVAGYRANFVYCVNGKRLRSGIYPPVTVLYRRHAAYYRQDGHTHRLMVDGVVGELAAPILHDDRKSLRHWFQSQVRYTELEARKLLKADDVEVSWPDRIRRWRVLAPPAMLFYCLIIRGGIFDGWAGFYYAFQRTVAELMLSLYLLEVDLRLREEKSVSLEHTSEDEMESEKWKMNYGK